MPSLFCGASAADAGKEIVRSQIEQLRDTGQLTVEGTSLAAVRLIPEIYERRDFEFAWNRAEQVQSLVRLVENSRLEGLNPEDYHLSAIQRGLSLIAGAQLITPDRRVDLDLLFTDSLIRLGYHLRFGKVNPEELDPHWNFRRDLGEGDPVAQLLGAIDSDSLQDFIDEVLPRGFYYQRLKRALARYRNIQAAGGWLAVPEGPTLKPGMRDERIPVLVRRLLVTGDLGEGFEAGESDLYSEAVEQGVKAFQDRHGLASDGVVGRDTLAALNVPVKARVDQIRVNFERARWVFDDIEDEFVLVNIAGFRVFLINDRKVTWSARAQVGRTYRKTPVFKSTMKYLVLNPTWTVPPGILAKDILPRVKTDPSYLKTKNMDLIDRNGSIVDPASVDWTTIGLRNMPYQFVQRPGPSNAMGRIKFMFPNLHLVFLHDTPSKSLFERADRTFSSGCIRIESPVDLAELLLGDEWSREKLDKVIESGKTQTIFLEEPMTVMLLYWTASVDGQGRVQFTKDIYERDQRIIDGLNEPFRMGRPQS